MAPSENRISSRAQIVIAVLTLIGILGGGLLANWEKVFPEKVENNKTSNIDVIKNIQPVENIAPIENALPIKNNSTTDFKNSYFQFINSNEIPQSTPDNDINTGEIAQSRFENKLYSVNLEEINVKIGVVEINSKNNSVIVKLTDSSEPFNNTSGKKIPNLVYGKSINIAHKGYIVSIELTKIKKSGRDKASFNLKAWELH